MPSEAKTYQNSTITALPGATGALDDDAASASAGAGAGASALRLGAMSTNTPLTVRYGVVMVHKLRDMRRADIRLEDFGACRSIRAGRNLCHESVL